MTDKQIIIDGVDVSGCPYYRGHDICKNTCHYFGTPCEWVDAQNCTYKQFKRAEQRIVELNKTIQAKEQECEELKEAQKNSRCAWKSLEGAFCPQAQEQLNQLKLENKHLNDLLNQALKELEKTRETLTEIKEIANREVETSRYNGSSTWKQILQKISESEGNDEL